MSEEEKEAIGTVNSYLLYSDINKTENNEACELVNLKVLKAMKKVLNLIEKQNKVIDKMAEKINQAYFDEGKMYIWFEKNIIPNDLGLQNIGIRKQRIKEYFYKEIEND